MTSQLLVSVGPPGSVGSPGSAAGYNKTEHLHLADCLSPHPSAGPAPQDGTAVRLSRRRDRARGGLRTRSEVLQGCSTAAVALQLVQLQGGRLCGRLLGTPADLDSRCLDLISRHVYDEKALRQKA